MDKFPGLLDQNCIPRTERACVAMGAAGVRPVSEVVRGYVAGYVNHHEDDGISERVSGRANLIRTILEGAAATVQEEDHASHLDSMRFIRVDELTMRWRLRAFNREWPDSPPEPAFAHWDNEEHVVFFVNRDDGTTPWSAIARELTLALAPMENPASISPRTEERTGGRYGQRCRGAAERVGHRVHSNFRWRAGRGVGRRIAGRRLVRDE